MPRSARIAPGGHVLHIMNRAIGHGLLFEGPTCYRDFLELLSKCADEAEMRIFAYCLMPNHWHMLVWPRREGDLWRFVKQLTMRHAHRWHVRKGTVGRGSLYQGRYKSGIVQTDRHLLTVCRYIERNPLRAGLVTSALAWPWSSAPLRAQRLGVPEASFGRLGSSAKAIVELEPLLVELPDNWVRWLDDPQTAAELARLRLHIQSGRPFGEASWVESLTRSGAIQRGTPE